MLEDVVEIEIDGDTSRLEKNMREIPKIAKDVARKIDPIEFRFKQESLAKAQQRLRDVRQELARVRKE